MPENMDEDLQLACSRLTWLEKRAAYTVACALWAELATSSLPLVEEARRRQTLPLDPVKLDAAKSEAAKSDEQTA